MKITVEFNSLEELRASAKDLEKIALQAEIGRASIAGEDTKEETKEEKKPAKKATAKKAEPKPEPVEEEPEETEAPAEEEAEEAAGQEHTETDLKMLLSGKLKAGKKAEVKELFAKYGVNCLTDLIKKNADKLDQIYDEAEAI